MKKIYLNFFQIVQQPTKSCDEFELKENFI